MHIAARLEIHFHRREQISVVVESSSSAGREESGEIGLFAMSALRLLNSLGKSKAAEDLAQLLRQAADLIAPLADGRTTGGVELVGFPGRAGKRRFYAEFELHDEEMRFDLQPQGFGRFGGRLGHYCPLAVIALLRFLAMKRAGESDYLQRLAAAASACGDAYSQGNAILHQHQLVAILFGESVDPAPLASSAARNASAPGSTLPERRPRPQPGRPAKPPTAPRPATRWPRFAVVLIGVTACAALLPFCNVRQATPRAVATEERPDTAAPQDAVETRGEAAENRAAKAGGHSAARSGSSATHSGHEREQDAQPAKPERNNPRRGKETSRNEISPPSPEERTATPHQDDHQPPANNVPRNTLTQGMHAFWNRDYDDALECLQSARDLAPHNAGPVYFLALVHSRQGQALQAEAALDAAVRIEASHPLADWGRLMERVQGRERLWLEEARAKLRSSRAGQSD